MSHETADLTPYPRPDREGDDMKDSQSQPSDRCADALSVGRDAEPSAAGKVRNRATPEGQFLGRKLAAWCDDAEPAARLRMPELPPRCNSCAFRAGPHTANGSPETQMDALKCIMEGHEFLCHEPAREGHLCSGWAMVMLAKDAPDFVEVDWPFSDELSASPASPAHAELSPGNSSDLRGEEG